MLSPSNFMPNCLPRGAIFSSWLRQPRGQAAAGLPNASQSLTTRPILLPWLLATVILDALFLSRRLQTEIGQNR